MKIILTTVLIHCFAVSAFLQPLSYSDSAEKMIVDSLQKVIQENKIPGMVAGIIDATGLIGSGSVGIRKENSKETFTPEDVIHLGSCTKAMTAVMIATLVQENVISWSTTIIEVFPELKDSIHKAYHPVALWQLLTHGGGIHANAEDWYANRNLELKLRRKSILVENLISKPKQKSGKYLYSNLGYMIAGSMVEKLTGLTWEELITERLFKPLGMTTAGFGAPNMHDEIDQPWGHVFLDRTWKSFQSDNAEALGPAGRVHCSLADWAKFIVLQLPENNSTILTKEQLIKLTEAEGTYAGGWVVGTRSWADGITLSHAGSNTSWYALVWVAPNIGRAYVVVTNSADDNSSKVCNQVIGQLIAIDKAL